MTTREVAPFSFHSLYSLARWKDTPPHDPYDMSRWRIVRRGRTASVRYSFHTRSLPIDDLVQGLSRAVPDVAIALVTHCLDDSSFGAFRFVKGRRKVCGFDEEWGTPFWERAAREGGMSLDDAYDDDEAERRAEELMLDEAMRIASGVQRRRNWSGGRVYRDLEDERANFFRDLAAAEKGMDDGE